MGRTIQEIEAEFPGIPGYLPWFQVIGKAVPSRRFPGQPANMFGAPTREAPGTQTQDLREILHGLVFSGGDWQLWYCAGGQFQLVATRDDAPAGGWVAQFYPGVIVEKSGSAA